MLQTGTEVGPNTSFSSGIHTDNAAYQTYIDISTTSAPGTQNNQTFPLLATPETVTSPNMDMNINETTQDYTGF